MCQQFFANAARRGEKDADQRIFGLAQQRVRNAS
jgi:hypothetical protein